MHSTRRLKKKIMQVYINNNINNIKKLLKLTFCLYIILSSFLKKNKQKKNYEKKRKSKIKRY